MGEDRELLASEAQACVVLRRLQMYVPDSLGCLLAGMHSDFIDVVP